ADRKLHDAAWEILRNAEDLANRAGISSGHLWWGLSAMADERGDAENAVRYVLRAVKHDPAAPVFLHSYGIVRERLLTTFKNMDATDPAVPHFFRLIADLDAVDAAVLIKLSRNVAAAGGN